ncbi:MAG: glycosyltransferase family 39 protein [Reyranella sp.]|nr:glycosyltransferase family 39 protein [Reyranella sp.]
MRPNLDSLIAVGCFGVACAIGLVGAFVGLRVSSFWLDELFTAWIVEVGIGFDEFVARIVTDVHPPVYYGLAFVHAHLFGDGEVGLRSLSAVCGVAAILLFVAATKPYFSLAARLFGGAMATGSFFWFYHAQNARGYSLAFLIGVAILVVSLSLLSKRSRREARVLPELAGLAVLMLIGSFVHFYLMYECLAVLIVLGFFCPRQRLVLAVLAVVLLVSTGLYVKVVIEVFSQYSTTRNWIHGDPAWYFSQLRTALIYSFTNKALLALAICAAAFAAQRLLVMRPGWFGRVVPRPAAASKPGILAFGRFPLDPETALFVGVPLAVLAGGIASSLLIAPNFTDRNLLVSSPFLWAFCAKLYDAGVPGAERPIRVVANLALSAIVLWMAVTMTAGRSRPWNEPFRQSAEWIKTFPECRDRPVVVINAQPRAWFKPGYSEILYADFYGNYLAQFARPQVVFIEDILAHKISDEMKEYLQWRLDGNGCPILAWSIHLITEEEFAAAGRALLKAVDRPDAGRVVRTNILRDGLPGYVLYAEGPRAGEGSQARDPRAPPSQRKTSPAPTPTRRVPAPK